MIKDLLRSGRHTRHSGVYRRVLAVGTSTLAIFALAMTVSAVNVAQIVTEINIPITKIVRAPAGSETFLTSAVVPDEFIGKVCLVVARSANQGSVHPDNDLVVSSGGSEVVLRDVEGESEGAVVAQGDLELGPQVVVTLVMGPDKVFSAGMTVVVDCSLDPPETSTTPPAETTTTVEVLPTEVTGTTLPVVTTAPPVDATTIPVEVLPTEVVASTVPVEVLPTEVSATALPFTGIETQSLSLLALALGGSGVLFLVATRSIVKGRHERPRGQRRTGAHRRR